MDDEAAMLEAYVGAIGTGCAIESSAEKAAPASVELRKNVAWVRFGTGPLSIPTEAAAVVVDLRDAVEGDDLVTFLDSIGQAVIDAPVPPLTALVREHVGMRDEAYAPIFLGQENAYDDRMALVDLSAQSSGASRHVAMGVLCGERIAPSAARFALTLRAAGRAALLGHDVRASVAESVWVGVHGFGFAHRVATLHAGDVALPDIVPADVAGDDDDALAEGLAALGTLGPLSGQATRADLAKLPNTSDIPPLEFDLATRTAAVITAHGATKVFFPYWDVVGDDSDSRLVEAAKLAQMDEDDDDAERKELGFLSFALHDSHGFVFHTSMPSGVSHIPAMLVASTNGEPLVRYSAVPQLVAGDTIVAVDGIPAADIMAERGQYVSASASSAYRNSASTLLSIDGPTTFHIRDASAAEHDVSIDPADLPQSYPYFPTRVDGTLVDRGHPELFYVNLDASHLTAASLPQALAGIDAASGVVLDMRGYPSAPAWTLVNHVLPRGAPGVPMNDLVVSPFSREFSPIPQPFNGDPNGYSGKIAMLVGTFTQSQAEHVTLVLQSANRVHVIGQPTAGANGNITGVLLPGGFGYTFTGLQVLEPDLSPFHGVGCSIDEPIALDAAALAGDQDPELDAAIQWLAN
jgi:hypothetical protein